MDFYTLRTLALICFELASCAWSARFCTFSAKYEHVVGRRELCQGHQTVWPTTMHSQTLSSSVQKYLQQYLQSYVVRTWTALSCNRLCYNDSCNYCLQALMIRECLRICCKYFCTAPVWVSMSWAAADCSVWSGTFTKSHNNPETERQDTLVTLTANGLIEELKTQHWRWKKDDFTGQGFNNEERFQVTFVRQKTWLWWYDGLRTGRALTTLVSLFLFSLDLRDSSIIFAKTNAYCQHWHHVCTAWYYIIW